MESRAFEGGEECEKVKVDEAFKLNFYIQFISLRDKWNVNILYLFNYIQTHTFSTTVSINWLNRITLFAVLIH